MIVHLSRALYLLLTAFVISGSTSHAGQPNIVIFLADDQGWGDLSVHGNTNLSTPNIDSLARDGALFDRFYVCPVCAPTRAEFLTGRYYARTGVRGVSTGQERLNADEITLADTFRRAGYATGAFGKWHNGSQHPYHPNARGFDEYYGFTSGHWGHYFDPVLEHNGEITRGKGYIIDDLTNHAIDFIESNVDEEKPFLCYLPYNTPHSPMQVPDEFFEKHADQTLAMHHRDPEKEDLPHLRAALAMCENIDWNVGRVLEKLEQRNISDNTIVIYFSDNGPNGWRWNDDMKGRKGSIDEGGVRVPCLIRWPAKIPPGTRIQPIAGAIDFLPTLTDLAGVPIISKKPLDGKSLRRLLLGESKESPDRSIISYRSPRKNQNPQVSVRSQQYRLDAGGALFDMIADPGQRENIAADHPTVVEKMKATAAEFVDSVRSEIGPDDRPFPIGGATVTNLPARDGVEHGGVTRSARAPNCSYFSNWTQIKDDKITWDVEVLDEAEYEVIIYYTCPADSVGSRFELVCGQARLPGKVSQANDPPAYGFETDRTPDRGNESYVKNFKPMSVGKIQLSSGRHVLSLQAVEIPGDQVMEVRLVQLRKQ